MCITKKAYICPTLNVNSFRLTFVLLKINNLLLGLHGGSIGVCFYLLVLYQVCT